MKEELNKFAEWLWKEKGLSVFEDIEEYNNLFEEKPTKTLEELLNFLCKIHNISYEELTTRIVNSKSRYGTNDVPRARGQLVRYVLNNNIPGFKVGNVYSKLFNIPYHHSNVYHYLRISYLNEELQQYNKLVNYIQLNNIQWQKE